MGPPPMKHVDLVSETFELRGYEWTDEASATDQEDTHEEIGELVTW